MTEEQEKQIYADRLVTITASLIAQDGYHPRETVDIAQRILHNILGRVVDLYDEAP